MGFPDLNRALSATLPLINCEFSLENRVGIRTNLGTPGHAESLLGAPWACSWSRPAIAFQPVTTRLPFILCSILFATGLTTLAARPNLLVIQTDEHNFRTLGCYRDTLPADQAFMWGEAVVKTPNIDWLASNGALCTSFYATTPVCSPFRGTFMSGRYPQNTPVVQNNIPLGDDIITFAEMLRRHGYATGYAGKWHLDGLGKPQWAPQRKFGWEDNRFMFNRGHWKQFEDTPSGPRVAARKNGKPTYGIAGATEGNFSTDWLCRKAMEFIQEKKGQPFCYYISLPDPHGPDTVRAPYDTMFDHQTYQPPRTQKAVPPEALPSWGKKSGSKFNMAKYYGMVKCIDDNIGKIIAFLKKQDLLEKTIIVFTADHGDLRGEHDRHNKGVPYEGSAKIPFIIHYPGVVKRGAVIHEALGSVDFQPTILSLMKVPRSGDEEGRDVSGLFRNGKAPDQWQDVTFLRSTGGPDKGWIAAVSDRYKLIFSHQDPPWLYDLKTDPDELRNQAAVPANREVVRRLASQLLDYAKATRDGRVDQPKIRADIKRALSGL